MQIRKRNPFSTITIEGAILPADLLQRVAEGDGRLDGLKPSDYHLIKGEKITEAITRAWNRLLGAWSVFQATAEVLKKSGRPGTTETRERWLLPLFQELGYGRLQTSRAIEIEGKTYPVSHGWGHIPIHLVGFNVDLDRRTEGVAGAARSSPHSMLQELLNRSDKHLWGFLSNGLKLRILRDNASLVRQAYVEFDLEAMMEGEAYSDFVLLWLLCHESRVEGETPDNIWLETWSKAAHEQGARALDALRDGVEEAISAFGAGFLAHPENHGLRERLRSGELDKQDYYRQLLRLVYRLIFLFVAEDRDLLLLPDASAEARERYNRYYGTRRLRDMAEKHRGTRHRDLYEGLKVVMRLLGSEKGEPALALPALGSFLWSDEALPDLAEASIANHDLLDAVRALSLVERDGQYRPVDYANLGPEELGSIYESLLELHPAQVNPDSARFRLETVTGSERKTTGSYYTPESLISSLLDTALNPLLDEAERSEDPEKALLDLKVCDPAAGSGHFLIAAAHRIASRLASVRTGDEQPGPEAVRHALRDVIGRCLYGVDINPMAVELCKVNLWLDALEPGRPLSFLDHHIQVGNSLLGATPRAIREGIPDDSFKTITGDDSSYASEYRKKNRDFRRTHQYNLFEMQPWERLGNMPEVIAELEELPDDSVAAVQKKKARYEAAMCSQSYEHARLLADAWCAAFVWKKRPDEKLAYPIHEEVFRKIERNPHATPVWMKEEIRRLSNQYRFFHWHLAFPDVFRVDTTDPDNELGGWKGGFDLMLGNPPWERVKLQEKEWFAPYRPDIAGARNKAERTKLIKKLEKEDPALHEAFEDAKRQAEGESHLLRDSGLYPLCGRGDVNTYQIFAELFRTLMSASGRAGFIVPSGIATDDTTKYFFQDLMDTRALASLYDFENKGLFPAVDSRMKFSLLTLTGHERPSTSGADFVFFAHSTSDLKEEDRHFTLTAKDIALLNPNTRTCPIFRSKRDAELTRAIYRRVPVLIKEGLPEENPWGIRFSTMFHMSNDSHLFRTREQLEKDGYTLNTNHFVRDKRKYLPLQEGRLGHQFDHRFAVQPGGSLLEVSLAEKKSPDFSVEPQYFVREVHSLERIDRRNPNCRSGLLGFRRVSRNTDERTSIATILPFGAASYGWILTLGPDSYNLALLCGIYNAFVFDYTLRNSLSQPSIPQGTFQQLPVLPPEEFARESPWSTSSTIKEWLLPRILELIFTAWDLSPFAQDCDYDGPPFRWDEERRQLLRAELDSAYFHLYLGTPEEWTNALRSAFPSPRDAVDYILETFPIVKKNDIREFGDFRTKKLILHVYDKMQEAIESGIPYETILDPPPADPRVAHPPREVTVEE